VKSLKRPDAAQSNLPASTMTPPMAVPWPTEKLGRRIHDDIRSPFDGRVRAARHRRSALAVQRVPAAAGHRDAPSFARAPLPERARCREATSSSIPAWSGSTILASNPAATISARKSISPNGQGAIITFGIKGGYEAGKKLINSLELFSLLATSATPNPWSFTPPPLPTSSFPLKSRLHRRHPGTGPSLRGIEDIRDILADLDQAIENAQRTHRGRHSSKAELTAQ